MEKNKGIGIFDSGVGGLSVASRVHQLLPRERIIYFGDTANLPYGDKTPEQIIGYVNNIIKFLMGTDIKALVMACNTSSALVLPRLKGNISVPTLGVIEYASRMALQVSANERIGVVANPVTTNSGAYPSCIVNISLNGTRVYQQACPRWVPLVESGIIEGDEVEKIVAQDIEPLLRNKVDTIILGCTHYPFLSPVIRRIAGDGIRLVDPAGALSEHLQEILARENLLSEDPAPEHRFFVSGDPEEFRRKGSLFFGREIPPVEKVEL